MEISGVRQLARTCRDEDDRERFRSLSCDFGQRYPCQRAISHGISDKYIEISQIEPIYSGWSTSDASNIKSGTNKQLSQNETNIFIPFNQEHTEHGCKYQKFDRKFCKVLEYRQQTLT